MLKYILPPIKHWVYPLSVESEVVTINVFTKKQNFEVYSVHYVVPQVH